MIDTISTSIKILIYFKIFLNFLWLLSLLFDYVISHLKKFINVKRLGNVGLYCCINTTLVKIIAIPVYYKA